MGAVSARRDRAVIVVSVPTVDVVDIAIAVVVFAVAGDFAMICPEIAHQIRVSDVHAPVHHGDDDLVASLVLAAGSEVPGTSCADVDLGAGIMETPLFRETRI